jgi:hypothetical protein
MNNAIDQSVMDFDLNSYLKKFGAVPLPKDEWSLTCPICNREKLVVNAHKKQWHCWVCEEYKMLPGGKKRAVRGAGGLLSLIGLLENCSIDQARKLVTSGGSVRGSYFRSYGESPRRGTVEIPPPMGWKPISTMLPYCVERGITFDDIRQFGLVFCDIGRYRNRLIFPIWEEGKLVYYQARAMWQAKPGENYVKALNPPSDVGAASPAEVLMNLDTARYFDRVAVVEGPIDCVHAGPSAVCTLGKRISVAQMLKMKKAGVRAIDLIWDGPSEREPEGAWPEMRQAASQLSGIFDTRLVFLPHGDPGDYTRSELEQFRRKAKPASAVSGLACLG